jgi:hypothetical protein
MISVVIRTKDEADRLRLALGSLSNQLDGHELIVVNDGSIDHTDLVISKAMVSGNIKVIRHEKPLGRSAASNAGASIAKGDILLFLDGDVLASPNLLMFHQNYHLKNPNRLARGENRHLRCTRTFLNPELATPFPSDLQSHHRRTLVELERLKVTLNQINSDFDSIDRRSELSIYSGIHPQTLFKLETSAILEWPNCSVLWAAASGHNTSVSKGHFFKVGGFDAQIDINEQRELAFKLSKIDVKAGYIHGAKSYHMLHQSGWRNPMMMPEWEKRFLTLHPIRAVALLNIFWGTIANPNLLPAVYQIHNLLELEVASINPKKTNYDEARSLLGLNPLGARFWQQEEC